MKLEPMGGSLNKSSFSSLEGELSDSPLRDEVGSSESTRAEAWWQLVRVLQGSTYPSVCTRIT